jgi:hypothetical protein
MSQEITPEELQALAAGYVLNELTPEEAAQLESLGQNPGDLAMLKAEIEQMEQALEGGFFEAEVAPPAALKAKVLASFATTAQAGSPDPSSSPSLGPSPSPSLSPSPGTGSALQSGAVVNGFSPKEPGQAIPEKLTLSPLLPAWVKWAGAVAAATIIGLALSNYALWRSLQSQRLQLAQLSAPPSPSSSLNLSLQPTALLSSSNAQADQVQASVELDPATLTGKLTLENLPPLQPGQVYVLWTVLNPDAPFTTDAKGAILTQVFTVSGEGQQSQALNLPLAFQQAPNQVRAMAITIEDANAPQGHQAAPILIQEI